MSTFADVFDYVSTPKEGPLYCNLCAEPLPLGEYVTDRYGYRVSVVTCGDCGLVALNPRMTPETYKAFYADGTYRKLVSAYHGRPINAETLVPEQKEYGKRVRVLLRPWLQPEHETLLDIGGSTGAVAAEVGIGMDQTILEPAVDEAPDVDTISKTIEEYEPSGEQWDVILLCQTIDHLLDPMGALRKTRRMLAHGGVFWVDALDYDRTRMIKIDHPFNLTESTMRQYLHKAGFTAREVVRNGDHVGFVCQGAE